MDSTTWIMIALGVLALIGAVIFITTGKYALQPPGRVLNDRAVSLVSSTESAS